MSINAAQVSQSCLLFNSLKVLGAEKQKMEKELQSKDRQLVNIQKRQELLHKGQTPYLT